ncbi:type II toxin-antitoxin system VapC family toxin [Methylomagnum sp.]
MNADSLVLLDTHVWIWWVEQDDRLPKRLAEIVEDQDNRITISAVSIYELTYGAHRGRIRLNREVDDWIKRATVGADIAVMPVDAAIARRAGHLPPHHGDPLDRIIIATAIQVDARLASLDTAFPAYRELDEHLIRH